VPEEEYISRWRGGYQALRQRYHPGHLFVLPRLEAAEPGQDGIDVEVIDLRTLKPLDIDTNVTSVTKTGRFVGLTEAYENTSFINEVMAQVNELAFDWLDAPMQRVAAANVPVPRAEVLEDMAIPNVGRIVQACKKVVS
jgi:pyruvate/2-oxoglutarate/acetoin dehydrogenase E1 component